MSSRSGAALLLLSTPYREFEPVSDLRTLRERPVEPGSVVIWRLRLPVDGGELDTVQARAPGLPLMAVLPPVDELEGTGQEDVLRIVEQCRPHSLMPFHPRPAEEDARLLLARPPQDLGAEVTEYLAWRGIRLDMETRRIVRRVIELSSELRTVAGLARSLYLSRRALGRRFTSRGVPVPSHWLHFSRLLRALISMHNSGRSVFEIACELGYPDGFALSNQMSRLCDVRPTEARHALGWEWFLEAWLVKEAREGGMSTENAQRILRPDDTARTGARRPESRGRGTGRITRRSARLVAEERRVD